MNEFRASWEKDWIGVSHLESSRLFGFAIQQNEDGTLHLIGGVVIGPAAEPNDPALHAAAAAFARDEVGKRFVKRVTG